jgi:hypothetical protein
VLEDAAVLERRADLIRRLIPIKALGRVHDARRKIGHRGAREVELSLEDDGVGLHVADRALDVPQRAGPDASIGMDLAAQVFRVVQVAIDATQAVRTRTVYEVASQSATQAGSRVGEMTCVTVTAQ